MRHLAGGWGARPGGCAACKHCRNRRRSPRPSTCPPLSHAIAQAIHDAGGWQSDTVVEVSAVIYLTPVFFAPSLSDRLETKRPPLSTTPASSLPYLIQDMDLSLRCYLRGWGGLYLPHVDNPNELPSSLASYKTQQFR